MSGQPTAADGERPTIRVRGLCKSFGANLVGLMRPESGSIAIDGAETVGLHGGARNAVLAKFGVLFQGAALFDGMPVWENVAFGLIHNRGIERGQAREAAIEKLAQVGLGGGQADRYPSELSSGMQKRVALARAIAIEPEILFFDEPTTGLDPIVGDAIDELIVQCVRGLGATALTITHDMASARRIADRIAMIHAGKIVWAGPAAAVDDSGDPAVDQFIHGRTEGPIRTAAHAA